VLGLATLAVAERTGAARADVAERLDEAFGALASLEFFDMPRIDISSSAIRKRVAAGRPIRYLVPDLVADRIEQGRLYR
jgi:nicotinate-nucleotide adenylyltransferase